MCPQKRRQKRKWLLRLEQTWTLKTKNFAVYLKSWFFFFALFACCTLGSVCHHVLLYWSTASVRHLWPLRGSGGLVFRCRGSNMRPCWWSHFTESGKSYSDWGPTRSCWCCWGQRMWWAMRERPSLKKPPPPQSPPSQLHTAVFGIRLQAPTLRPPWSSHPLPSFSLSLSITDGWMTSTHVPLLSFHPFLCLSVQRWPPQLAQLFGDFSSVSFSCCVILFSDTCSLHPSLHLPFRVSLLFFSSFLSACLSLFAF